MSRRWLLVAGAAASATPLLLRGTMALAATATPAAQAAGYTDGPNARAFGFPEPDTTSKVTRDITFPVAGPVSWSDTFGACRDGCSRPHEGQDLMGTKLQRLVACVDGTVVGYKYDTAGNYLYLQDGDGWYYGYLHINNDTPGTDDGKNPKGWAFAPGIAMGTKVYRGQHIAYVGDSGNAESTPPHCHFELRKPTSAGVWKSQAVNAKYSLDAATPPAPKVPPSTFVPWTTSTDLVTYQYADFLGRFPTTTEMGRDHTALDAGAVTPSAFIATLLASTSAQDTAGCVARLYPAFFGRTPDYGGFTYWLAKVRSQGSAMVTAEFFARSREFVGRFGASSNAGYVDTVYRNVLGREPDASGRQFWIDQLDQELVTRGGLMLRFSESNENRTKLQDRTDVILLYALMLQRIPTESAITTWTSRFAAGTHTVRSLIEHIRKSAEYARRF